MAAGMVEMWGVCEEEEEEEEGECELSDGLSSMERAELVLRLWWLRC